MPIPVTITLTSVSGTTGPFSLYSCIGVTCAGTPFETLVSLASLQGGYGNSNVPDGTTSIKIKSTGVGCDYEITKPIVGLPTGTPTPTPTPTGPTSTPTPTTTSTITPTPTSTQIVGQCYTITVSTTVNQDNYGIRFTDPNVGAEQSVKFNMLPPQGDGASYALFYICSTVDPTLLDYTGGFAIEVGSISGVTKSIPTGSCTSSFDCISSITATPTPTPSATPTGTITIPTVDTCGGTATFAIINNATGVNVDYTLPTDGSNNFAACTLTGSPLSPGTSDSFIGGFGPTYSTEISGAGGKTLRTWVGNSLFSTINITGTSYLIYGDASYGSSFVILEIID
jgi:hypothetical protein